MEALKRLAGTAIGKGLLWLCAALAIAMAVMGVWVYLLKADIRVEQSNNGVLSERVKTKDEVIARKNDQIKFQNAWAERERIDAEKKDEEFKRAMAAKPVYKTKIEYIPTGNKCVDYDALIDEARGANHAK